MSDKQVIVVKQSHGALISVLLLLFAWPLAFVYWAWRLFKIALDWLTLGPIRRR